MNKWKPSLLVCTLFNDIFQVLMSRMSRRITPLHLGACMAIAGNFYFFQWIKIYRVGWSSYEWMMNWNGRGRKRPWVNTKVLSQHLLEELRESTRDLSYYIGYLGRDLNPPPDEAGVLTTRPRRSVSVLFISWTLCQIRLFEFILGGGSLNFVMYFVGGGASYKSLGTSFYPLPSFQYHLPLLVIKTLPQEFVSPSYNSPVTNPDPREHIAVQTGREEEGNVINTTTP
jgi:hypothetical protein